MHSSNCLGFASGFSHQHSIKKIPKLTITGYGLSLRYQAQDKRKVNMQVVNMTAGATPHFSSSNSATKTNTIIKPVAAEPKRRKLQSPSNTLFILHSLLTKHSVNCFIIHHIQRILFRKRHNKTSNYI